MPRKNPENESRSKKTKADRKKPTAKSRKKRSAEQASSEEETGLRPTEVAPEEEVQALLRESDRLFNESSTVGGSLSQYLRDLRQFPPLSSEEEQAVARLALAGNKDAQEKLVRHNLRFVVTIAKGASNRGVPLEDLIAEGNQGLLKAVTKFDPEYGVKFISYAVWWINQSIRAAIASQQRSFRLPLNRATQLSHIHRAIEKLTEAHGRPPTVADIAKETEIPVHMVKTLLAVRQNDLSLDANESLETGAGAQGVTLSERIAAENGTEEQLEARFRAMDINKALAELYERDEIILRLFFGLDGGREHTLEEIGQLLGITRERVRQLRDRALKRLREQMTAQELKDYHTD